MVVARVDHAVSARAVVIVLTLATLAGSPPDRDVVARVGGREIRCRDVADRAARDARARGAERVERRDLERALTELVDEEALFQLAERRDLARDDATARRLLVLAWLGEKLAASEREPTRPELERFHTEHRSEYGWGELDACLADVRGRWALADRKARARAAADEARALVGVEKP